MGEKMILDNSYLLNRIKELEKRLAELELLFKPFTEDNDKDKEESE